MPVCFPGRAALLLIGLCAASFGKTVVFWQPGFPTAESQPVPRQTLDRCFGGASFTNLNELEKPAALTGADLLVLPYGSAFPESAWPEIHAYLQRGGHLLNIGGRAFFVPVNLENGAFIPERVQNTYARSLGIDGSYPAPQTDFAGFAWDGDHSYLASAVVRARRAFVMTGGGQGLGFLLNPAGERVAAALTSRDTGGRMVLLPFDPVSGYWASPDGEHLLKQAAQIALRKPTMLWLEVRDATLAGGEDPQVIVHVRSASHGTVRVDLLSGNSVLDSAELKYKGGKMGTDVVFKKNLAPGPYTLRGIYKENGKIVEAYHTGFWQRDQAVLLSGARMEAGRDYFRLNSAPFVPFGVNYFSSDRYPTGFFVGGDPAGNSYDWERDFAEMERSHVKFVRTGVWLNQADYLDAATGGVSERFLRGLEAYLLSAGRHHMQVEFTFFAFDPQTIRAASGHKGATLGPGSNPYTDPAAIQAQQAYVTSIVSRFKDVPYLSWDLINEPTFSNPARHFDGNVPNGDSTEAAAWNRWLETRYGSTEELAAAWGVPDDKIDEFGDIPLPAAADLKGASGGSSRAVRAIDYNLFAQAEFSAWAKQMIGAIRAAGSKGLVTVGQDEGGVTNRVLNQFDGGSGIDFTVNHTWWRDDALLWDSLAAKRPDMPNLIGETGVEPVLRMDDSDRQDEVTAFGLEERKLALGFAAGNSGGALHWTWEADHDFGLTRGDGSAKSWRDLLSAIGAFAEQARPYLTQTVRPEVAIVLPQSLQLSTHNALAVEAQQKCVRALYRYARGSAYAVGEYQLNLLGDPKLIIVPAPWVLSQKAWNTLLAKARTGTVLLISGRIDQDEHFHSTDRADRLDIGYKPGPLVAREDLVEWPGGRAWFSYTGDKTDLLDRGFLRSGAMYAEKTLGEGKLLYFAPPLELSSDPESIGAVYRFAIEQAGVRPVYTTAADNPGILICPTQLENATLYVLTSQSSSAEPFSFHDEASGKEFQFALPPGRAALLLVKKDGDVAASYNWNSH